MPTEKRRCKNIFNHLDTIEQQILKRKYANLFLDFDGTIAPIAPSPDKVKIPAETLGILEKMSDYKHVFLAIMTGRSFSNIKQIVNIKGMHFAANHGLEISGMKRGEIVPNVTGFVRTMKKISDDLNKVLLTVPGAWVENKSLTASVHYRNVPSSHVTELNRLVGEITLRYIEGGTIRLTRGNKVIEIRPNIAWDKGKAVRWMQKNIAKKRASNIYIGDDETDEDAFKVLNPAITVKVAQDVKVKTDAEYYVNNPTEVRFFLQWLLEKLATVK
jgi:trehalose-phosphatase